MYLENAFPKLTKRDKVRSAKRRRKYNSKNRKWAVRIQKNGYHLLCGTSTLCLDCGHANDNTRLGCSCWTPDKVNMKGVVYGVNKVIEIGTGIKTPMAKDTSFISFEKLKEMIENKERFFDLSSKEEIL